MNTFKEVITINEKPKLISTLSLLAEDEYNVFRGYSIQDQLLPKLISKKSVPYESDLLYEFERYSSQYINAANPIDFMSYAQHFGLSTRLLDFSYNPFVALYFATFMNKNNQAKNPDDNMYYYIIFTSLEENICIHEFPQKLASYAMRGQKVTPFPAGLNGSKSSDCERWSKWFSAYFNEDDPEPSLLSSRNVIGLSSEAKDQDAMKNKIKSKPILFFDPNQSNQRLVMQQGLFMYPYTLNREEHIRIVSQNSRLIKINKSLQNDIQVYLDKMGITAFRLMPDISSVCSAVEKLVKTSRYSRD